MERKVNKTINLDEVFFDEELYPRSSVYWQVSFAYSEEMKAGAKFPPIVLALYKKKLYLVDGKHRIDAHTLLKKKTIEAEIYTGWNKNKIFEEAIKRNITHGRVLSPFEKRKLVLKLRGMKYGDQAISDLIQVPLERLENFIAQRLINTLTGAEIVKTEISHVVDKGFSGEDISNIQKEMYSKSQVSLLKEVVTLLENNLLDLENKEVQILTQKLRQLLIDIY
jgi:hypothetical protein